VVDPILRSWAHEREPIPVYAAGSWGPRQADRLFERPHQAWRDRI